MSLAANPAPTPQVLVVDDDEALRASIADYLGQHGYGVHVASDALTMDKVLAAEPIDLIVLDVMMPGERKGNAMRGAAVHEPSAPFTKSVCST